MSYTKFLELGKRCVINAPYFLIILSLYGCAWQNKVSNQPSYLIVDKEQKKALLQDIYQNKAKVNLCNDEIDLSVSLDTSSVYLLGKGQYLVEFLCFLGAYQGNYEYYLYESEGNQSKIKALNLEVLEGRENKQKVKVDSKSIGGLPNYNSEQKLLTVFTKYRGLGDCGSLAQYQWENTGFKLVEYREKEDCDGNYIEPEKYTKIYP